LVSLVITLLISFIFFFVIHKASSNSLKFTTKLHPADFTIGLLIDKSKSYKAPVKLNADAA